VTNLQICQATLRSMFTVTSHMIIANVHNFYKEPFGVAAAIFAMESEPLLNRAGTLYFCTLFYSVWKRGDQSLVSKYKDCGVYSMNKTGSRQKLSVVPLVSLCSTCQREKV
jgi:hypothetical protein